MTRAWLLALVVAPAVASAQAAPTPLPGQVTVPVVARSATDNFVNAAECRNGSIALTWRPLFNDGASFAQVTSYQLYAANKVTTGACPISDNDKGDNSLRAGPVGSAVTTDLRETMIDVSFATSVIAARAGRGACDADGVIEVCVQALSGGTDIGTARGTLQLSLAKPAAPVLQSVTPGEQALNVGWDAPNPGAGESYEVLATTADPLDPGVVGTTAVTRSSGRVTATDARVSGLTNFAVYQVHVIAYSDADNPSDPSNAVTSSPLPVDDFFEAYKKAGGRETGGCASGGVGLLALAGVASLLALRRRS